MLRPKVLVAWATVTTTTTLLLFFCCSRQVSGNLITDIIDVKSVCPPDSMLCAHGGRAFRDRNHNCAFTPCEFVSPPTHVPTPSPGTQRTQNATVWFRNDEFFVPHVSFRDLKRGKAISDRVTKALLAKSERSVEWGKMRGNMDVVDLIAVPLRLSEHQLVGGNRTEAHNELLDEALTTGGDLTLGQQGRMLVASRKPWTRFAFFGWVARHPTPGNVQKLIHVVQEANSLDTLLKESQQQPLQVLDVVAELAPQQIFVVPSLVLLTKGDEQHSQDSVQHQDDQDSEPKKTNWLTSQPDASQAQVFAFLERRLMTMGHLEPPPPNNTAETSTSNVSRLKTNNATIANAFVDKERARRSFNESVKFTTRFKDESASIVAFLTPFASLVGDNRQEDKGTCTNTSGVWNFTMVLCDVFEKMRREEPHFASVPLTDLVVKAPGVDTINDEHYSGNATGGGFVFSCWFYQQIEDECGLPVANASATMRAVRYYHA